MGNLCGKESASDPFSQPGRTVSSPPPRIPRPISSLPKNFGGPPRTLASEPGAPEAGGGAADDARRKAAEAAEARANAAKPKGKLGSQLAEQKKQTRSDTLDAASREERRLRDADAGQETRAYN